MNNEASSFQARQVNIEQSDIRPAVKGELKTLLSDLKTAQSKYTNNRAGNLHLIDLQDRIKEILDMED